MNQHLRRKLTLRTGDDQIVFVKHREERIEHVWMKAFLWALYLPSYPNLAVEVSVGDRYKPDVVGMDDLRGRPVFWGEAGRVGSDKITDLIQRYPRTHLAIGKWDTALAPFVETVEDAVHGAKRESPVDLLRFPSDAEQRFVNDRGRVSLQITDVTWVRVQNAEPFNA